MNRSFVANTTETKKGARVANGAQYLLDLNDQYVRLFREQHDDRVRYREEHPTEIMVFKCMDGRLNASVWCNVPFGILQPMRNLGGKFSLGWLGLYHTVKDWRTYADAKGRRCLVVTSYHYSQGDTHRGCAGVGYEREAGIAAAKALQQQFEDSFVRVYGANRFDVITIGFETDYESLVLHGSNGEVINLANVTDASAEGLAVLLARLFPEKDEGIRNDLIPLLQGNIAHTAEIKRTRKDFAREAEHSEWVLGPGRGYDWLHEPSTALIINPFDYHLTYSIEKAAHIILANIVAERVHGNVVLMAVAPYYQQDGRPEEKTVAAFKAQDLNAIALGVIRAKVPELAIRLEQLTATINMDTRKLDVLELKKIAA